MCILFSPPNMSDPVSSTSSPSKDRTTADQSSEAILIQKEPPPPDVQRDVIGQLQAQDESLHVYCVSKTWYENWKKYVGLTENIQSLHNGSPKGTPPLPDGTPKRPQDQVVPGPIFMDCEDDNNNMLVDEKVWIRWVAWYGVSLNHELDRRNWSSDEKEFEICLLSPYCTILDNPLKDFDITEETGYVELQMRRIFKVPETRKTRLWVREKSRVKFGRFQLLLDRREELCYQDIVTHNHDYVLALEVGNPDASWPTNYPGEPLGDFSKYADLTRLQVIETNWQQELQGVLDSVFTGITGELQETTQGVVRTAAILTEVHEQELSLKRTAVKEDESRIAALQADLTTREHSITTEESRLQQDKLALQHQKQELVKDRQRLNEEMQHMAQVNSMADTRVKLDVGGIIYTTSVVTLTRDPDSMLAAMFSGRHEVKREPDGTIFLDRDGTHFRFILNFLRDGGFKPGTLPEDQAFLTELLTEAEYYQISGLVAFLATTLASIDDPELISHSHERASRRLSRKVANKK